MKILNGACFFSVCILLALMASMQFQRNYQKQTIPQHCSWLRRTKKTLPKPRSPPWFSILASGNYTEKKLYVSVRRAHSSRLGNRLFLYASLFGIAWKNRRIPIWPASTKMSAKLFDITKFFHLRIPMDVHKKSLQVMTK